MFEFGIMCGSSIFRVDSDLFKTIIRQFDNAHTFLTKWFGDSVAEGIQGLTQGPRDFGD